MPNRDIKESCRTSKNLAELSHGAERLFWRMTTYADDYGRMPADADIVRAACFPRLLERVSVKDVDKWLDEMRRVKLISCYNDSVGHHILFFLTWRAHQRTRAKHSKYDSPSSASICQHMTAYVAFRSEDTEVLPKTPNTTVTTEDTVLRAREGSVSAFEQFWNVYPKKIGKGAARKAWEHKHPQLEVVLAAVTAQIGFPEWQRDRGRFIPHPATWLNQERWCDQPHTGNGTRASLNENWKDQPTGEVKL